MKKLYKSRFVPMIVGIITTLIGFYYLVFKAGIPYQDPTPAMTEKYMSYVRCGEKLVFIGIVTIFVSIIYLIALKIIKIIIKKKKFNPTE